MLEKTCQEAPDIEQKMTETLPWVKKCFLLKSEVAQGSNDWS